MTSYESLKAFAGSLGADVLENEPMSRHTTFKIGGPADIFIALKNSKMLIKINDFCKKEQIPVFILGNGSNLLVSDKGIRGAVIKSYGLNNIKERDGFITCGAGVQLMSLCTFARDSKLSGLEFAYGIPGTVGGAVYMNAGAYGGEMKDIVTSVKFIEGSKVCEFGVNELDFGYRHSAFTGTGRIITEITFKLSHGGKEEINGKMSGLMERRRSKQPLERPSAGSVFKRPAGNFAGTLIEKCGLKGARVGGAMVSEKHAGFIVNAGGATCGDVLNLIKNIQAEVLKKTGVLLECEIRMVGEE